MDKLIIMDKLKQRFAPAARIRATAAKQRFAELLEAAARGPVAVERHGRVVAYVLSRPAYEELAGAVEAAAGAGELRAAKRRQQARDRAALRQGRSSGESMRLIPPALARRAQVRFKPVVFDD